MLDNEAEFEGVEPLIRKAIRLIQKGDPKDLDKIKGTLKLAATDIKTSVFADRFMTKFKDAYFDARFAGEDESCEETIFMSTWQEYLEKSDLVRGSPAYWYARFFQTAFIHRTIPDPDKHSARISNPLFEASTALAQVLKIKDFNSILHARSFLPGSRFPNLRSFINELSGKNKRGGILKQNIRDLSKAERKQLVRQIAFDLDLGRKDLIVLNRCAEVFYSDPGVEDPIDVLNKEVETGLEEEYAKKGMTEWYGRKLVEKLLITDKQFLNDTLKKAGLKNVERFNKFKINEISLIGQGNDNLVYKVVLSTKRGSAVEFAVAVGQIRCEEEGVNSGPGAMGLGLMPYYMHNEFKNLQRMYEVLPEQVVEPYIYTEIKVNDSSKFPVFSMKFILGCEASYLVYGKEKTRVINQFVAKVLWQMEGEDYLEFLKETFKIQIKLFIGLDGETVIPFYYTGAFALPAQKEIVFKGPAFHCGDDVFETISYNFPGPVILTSGRVLKESSIGYFVKTLFKEEQVANTERMGPNLFVLPREDVLRALFSALSDIFPGEGRQKTIEWLKAYLEEYGTREPDEMVKDFIGELEREIIASEGQEEAGSEQVKSESDPIRDADEDGASIEDRKTEAAALVGLIGAPIFIIFHLWSRSTFSVLLSSAYISSMVLFPFLTGHYIREGLLYKHAVDIRDTKRRMNLISPFREAEDIQEIEDHEEEAKGKISYFSYTIETKLKSGEEQRIKSALFVNKTALDHIPKLFQWIIYFHEWLHSNRLLGGAFRVKVEFFAVPLTFCVPWIIYGAVLILIPFSLLSSGDLIYLNFFMAYNLISPLVSRAIAVRHGLVKSHAGHYLWDPKVHSHLRDDEIDKAIVRYVHKHSVDEHTGESMYWRDWLKAPPNKRLE